MIKSRKGLEAKLSNVFSANRNNRKQIQSWINEAQERYGMPEMVSSDFINNRKDLFEASEFALFINPLSAENLGALAPRMKAVLLNQHLA